MLSKWLKVGKMRENFVNSFSVKLAFLCLCRRRCGDSEEGQFRGTLSHDAFSLEGVAIPLESTQRHSSGVTYREAISVLDI